MSYDKDIKCDYFTGSVVVSKNPCWLFSIFAMSSQVTSKVLKVRNGVVATSSIKMQIYASVYASGMAILNEPIYFDKGLYLEFGTNIDNVTVQYKPVY